MKATEIINLGQVKNLLAHWDGVRAAITKGRIKGFQTVFQDQDGEEVVYTGGVYQENPHAALKATLKASAARALTEDEPPQFLASQY